MAEGLNGKQVDGIRQRRVLKLDIVKRGRGAHGVDEHNGRLGGIDGSVGESISSVDAPEMWDLDGCGCRHGDAGNVTEEKEKRQEVSLGRASFLMMLTAAL